jgi:beta-galactosidase/beta-glucuronidase
VGADTRQRLDEALQNGVSVVLGVWLEHERRGFDYADEAQTADQTKRVLAAVRQYKNHPAVLMWGVGNEMEGYDSGDNPAIWSHVEQLCQLIKKEDPNHPTMSVIAEIGGRRIEAINRFCPSLDVIGINAYGGAATLPARYREAGGKRPYIVTEFGPAGPWEAKKNECSLKY